MEAAAGPDWAEASAAYTATGGVAKQPLIAALQDLPPTCLGLLWEEDHLLFPIAEKILTPDDQQELLERFAPIDMVRGRKWSSRFKLLVAGIRRSNERGLPWEPEYFDSAKAD